MDLWIGQKTERQIFFCVRIPKIKILMGQNTENEMIGQNTENEMIGQNTENENSYGSKYRKFKICSVNDFLTFCTTEWLSIGNYEPFYACFCFYRQK